MFWIGTIVGIVLAVVGLVITSRVYCARFFGSSEKWDEVVDALWTANENRKSYIQVFTDDEVLDTVVFEEIE